jgi:hypothetical protein
MRHEAKPLAVFTIVATVLFAILVADSWVGLLILFELVFMVGLAELLGMNLPTRLARQVGLNAMRADGSLSERRRRIEADGLRSFKINVFCCLALAIIPVNVALITHNYFLPQLKRFQATVELNEDQEWLGIFLHWEVQLILIIGFMAMFAYSIAKKVYFRLLKDLDNELTHRAENYAIHDLMTPRPNEFTGSYPVDNRQTV